MNKVAVDFCPEHFRIARMLKGFSQQELGEKVETSRQFIHQLESSIREPSEELLPSLCEALGIDKSFLYRSPIRELKSEQCHFRKRRTTTQAICNQVLAYGSVFEKFLDIVTEYVEIPSDRNIQQIKNKFEFLEQLTNNDIERAATEFRVVNGISENAPISNITDLIEANGVFITSFSGVSEKIDALSFERKYKVILRNSAKLSSCRQRFDLAHELGHLIFHEGLETGDVKTESQADLFASSLLFPSSAFRREFPYCLDRAGRIDWKALISLKNRWKVSLKALIYRAHACGIISAGQYRSANIHISKKGWSKREELDDVIPIETPVLLKNCVEVIETSLGVPFSKLAQLLGYKASSLSELFCLDITEVEEFSNVSLLFRN